MCSGHGIVKLLLSHGADPNAKGWHQRTPLHLASSKGYLDVSRLLIEYGANVDAKDDDKNTPFSIALANGHRKLARLVSGDRDE
jgi:ankyrin repeat protein